MKEFEDSIIIASRGDDNLIYLIITDSQYPETAAKKILIETKHSFLKNIPKSKYENEKQDLNIYYPELT